jgi:two-component system, sensor histidine kinase RegB
VLLRVGEPYVSTRSVARTGPDKAGPEGGTGLGLGLFIAKTLIERSGAQLSLANAVDPSTGAVVRIVWPRHVFEREAKGHRNPGTDDAAPLTQARDVPI